MAACGSLQHIFEKSLPESPTLLESLSPWKSIEHSSFSDIFGELHFDDENQVIESFPSCSSPSPSSSSSLFAELNQENRSERGVVDNIHNERGQSPRSCYYASGQKKHYKNSDSFSSMNSESLSLCTEGLGFESCDDVEDFGNEASFDFQQPDQETLCLSRQLSQNESICKESKRSRTNKGSFPPPISCIGRTGKPWVCFKSYRQDGRFILQEIRFPTQEFLHACREDGRLRLQYIQSDDEILEGDEEEEEEDEDVSSEDVEDVNEEKIGDDDFNDNNEHHLEHNNDAQEVADDHQSCVQMNNNNNVQDRSE